MTVIEAGTPAGRVAELLDDLLKQGRISNAEAAVIRAVIWPPELPAVLKAKPVSR